jgi:Zinc carboxypeptidase/Carboxypeptidase regulatory-like domain/FlgD Ig-like domain
MKKQLILVFIFILATIALNAEANTEYYFRFLLHDNSKLEQITNVISIDNIEDSYVYAYATSTDLERFRTMGYYPEILQHPGTLYKPVMSDSIDELREWDLYPTYDAYISIMYQFATDFPDICSVTSIGFTVEGREILVVNISDNVNLQEAEPEFFYSSTMHGDETTGYVLMLNLIEYLLTNYGSNQQVTDLVNGIDIWITPLANPDGTYHSGNNTVFGATRFNANGVDLNRNFPCPVNGPHPDGEEWQIETVIMMDFAATHHITMGANIHGGAEVINYPWDMIEELHPDDEWYYYSSALYASSAQSNSPAGYLAGFNNGVTNGYAWYETHGGRQDYMNYYHNAREVTMELSDIKLLPENQLEDHWNYNRDALLLYLEESMYGLHGTVTNDLGYPLDARIFVLNHDELNTEIYTDSEIGDYHRLLAGGTYDVEFSTYGYEIQTFEDVTITNGAATVVDVVLTEGSATASISGIILDAETGDPIENATVELLNYGIPEELTNAQGEYVISDIFEFYYDLLIYADGYASIIHQVLISEQSTELNFELYRLSDGTFEDGLLGGCWTLGGNADWSLDINEVYEGFFSARSGSIGHGENSSIEISLYVPINDEISFYKKVSSEADFDYLKFYIDGELQEQWSGTEDWTRETYPVTAGVHTFIWSYVKDGGAQSGSDCGWIDNIVFPSAGIIASPASLDFFTNDDCVNGLEFSVINVSDNAITLTDITETGSVFEWYIDDFSLILPYELNVEEQIDLNVKVNLQVDPTDEILTDFLYIDSNVGQISVVLNFDDTLISGVEDIPNIPILEFYGSYPNPFNPSTTISFKISSINEINTSLEIFNTRGQLVKTLVSEPLSSGSYNIVWNGKNEKDKNTASGLYYYKLKTDDFESSGKMLLLK